MNKKTIIIIVSVILVIVLGIFLLTKKSNTKTPAVTEDSAPDLPINVLSISERPFITLSPDSTGRSLDISLSDAPSTGSMEYEMIYNAAGKQEGALGSIYLGTEKQPIIKSILLGSKSGGGKITYHEGVTGGSITVTYGENRLKESWNYLKFDPTDPTISSTDVRFTMTFPMTAMKKDTVVITMKTFGYSKTGLPVETTKVISGPYGYFAQTPVKGETMVSIKLPAGEHVNPTIYELTGSTWKKLVTKLDKDTVSATATTGNVFLVMAE